jgi:hypothetical protein
MSLKTRILWVIPVLVAGSWLAVRSLAASPVEFLDDPPLAARVAAPAEEIHDPALARLVGDFAALARAPRR